MNTNNLIKSSHYIAGGKIKIESMKKLLEEQLRDYLKQFKENEAECIRLMKEGKDWKETAKKGAGLKLMIEGTLIELKRYS